MLRRHAPGPWLGIYLWGMARNSANCPGPCSGLSPGLTCGLVPGPLPADGLGIRPDPAPGRRLRQVLHLRPPRPRPGPGPEPQAQAQSPGAGPGPDQVPKVAQSGGPVWSFLGARKSKFLAPKRWSGLVVSGARKSKFLAPKRLTAWVIFWCARSNFY